MVGQATRFLVEPGPELSNDGIMCSFPLAYDPERERILEFKLERTHQAATAQVVFHQRLDAQRNTMPRERGLDGQVDAPEYRPTSRIDVIRVGSLEPHGPVGHTLGAIRTFVMQQRVSPQVRGFLQGPLIVRGNPRVRHAPWIVREPRAASLCSITLSLASLARTDPTRR